METDLDRWKTMLTKAGVQFQVYRGILTTAEPLRFRFNSDGGILVRSELGLVHTCTQHPSWVCPACKQTDGE
jgi:hypothetical protein